MRIKININILNNIKKQLIDKLNLNNHPEILKNMDKIKSLYVENLSEVHHCKMQSRPNEIAIDKQFVLFDKNDNPIKFKPELKQLIESQLGHELLHAASKNNTHAGINNSGSINNVGLNEGITQFLTEEVFGYTVSPFTDGYRDYKKIVKILNATFGYKPILRSYFYNTNDIEMKCNELSNNKEFYKELNKLMTEMFLLKKRTKENPNLITLYDTMSEIMYTEVIINIIIPKLKKLSSIEKKKYIKEIIENIGEHTKIKRYFVKELETRINMTNDELDTLKRNIRNKKNSIYENINFTKILKEDENEAIKRIIVYTNGKVEYIKKPKNININNEELLEDIYKVIYKTDKKYETMYKKIKLSNWILEINEKNLLYKKVLFTHFKEQMKLSNNIILNSLKELDTKNIILLKHIKNIKKPLEYNDLKTISNKYQVIIDEKSIKIFDKDANVLVTNDFIKKSAIFASLWFSLTEKDDKENKQIYNNVMNIITKNIQKDGNLGNEELIRYAESTNNKNIIKNLIKTNLRYETVYEYILLFEKNRTLQTEKEEVLNKGKSAEEITNSLFK